MSITNVSTEVANNKVLPGDKTGLPWEVWQIILSSLSAADLCRVACVCKTWNELVISVDSRRWKELYLACSEWRHPFWPLNTQAEPPSWRLAYRDQYISTKFWCRRQKHETRTMSCSVIFRKNVFQRNIHVGPGLEHESLKTALSVANDYDRIVVHPGIYDEQFEISAKIPFELIGHGELGSVILVVGIQQVSTTARLSNLVLRAPWFTSFIAIINSGYLQIDNCILEDGMICARNPSTVHIKFCTFRHASVILQHTNVSIIENCEFSQSGSANIFIEGHPKEEKNWTYTFLRDRTSAIYHQKRSLHRKKRGLKATTSLTSTAHSSLTGKSLMTGYSNQGYDTISHDPSYSFDDPGASFLNPNLLGPRYLGSDRDGTVGCGDLQSMYQESMTTEQAPAAASSAAATSPTSKSKSDNSQTKEKENSQTKEKDNSEKLQLIHVDSKESLLLPNQKEFHSKHGTAQTMEKDEKDAPEGDELINNLHKGKTNILSSKGKSLGSTSLKQLSEENSSDLETEKGNSEGIDLSFHRGSTSVHVHDSCTCQAPKHSALKKTDRRKSIDSHVGFQLDTSMSGQLDISAVAESNNASLNLVPDLCNSGLDNSFSQVSTTENHILLLSNTETNNNTESSAASNNCPHRGKNKTKLVKDKGKHRRTSCHSLASGKSFEIARDNADDSEELHESRCSFSKRSPLKSVHTPKDHELTGLNSDEKLEDDHREKNGTENENPNLNEASGSSEKSRQSNDILRGSEKPLSHLHLQQFPSKHPENCGTAASRDMTISNNGNNNSISSCSNNNSISSCSNNNSIINNKPSYSTNIPNCETVTGQNSSHVYLERMQQQAGPSGLNSFPSDDNSGMNNARGMPVLEFGRVSGAQASHQAHSHHQHHHHLPLRRSQSDEILHESDDDLSILDELEVSVESSGEQSDANDSSSRSTDSSDLQSLHFSASEEDFSSSEESVIMLPHLREFHLDQPDHFTSPRGVEAEITSISSECTRPVPVNVSEDTLMSSYVGQIQGCLIHQCRMNHSKGGLMISLQAHAIISECDISNVGYGIRCIQNSRVVILKNKIHHCRTSGIFMRLAASGLIAGNDVHSNNEAGIDIRKNADPLVQFNQIHHGKRSGIVILGSGRGQIKKNDIYSNAEAGVYVLYGGNPTISENYIYEGRAAGVAINAGGKGCVVDNVIRGNQWGGIDIRNGSCPLVSGNSIINGASDGIVIGVGGKGSIENNFICGNAGCGIWMMSSKHVSIHGNQICNSGHCGIMLLDKCTSSLEGPLGQLMTNVSHRTYSQYDEDFLIPEPTSDFAVLQYNNIYYNKSQGILIEIKEEVRMLYNAIHANQKGGVHMSQDAPAIMEGNSITSNSGSGIITSSHDKVRLVGNGIYDSTQHGIVCRNNCVVSGNDIVGHAMYAVLVEGKAQAEITNNRLCSSSVTAVKGEESSVVTATNNRIFDRGGGDFNCHGTLTASDNVLVRPTLVTRKPAKAEFNKTDFLIDPPPRPHIPPTPSSTIIPTHHVTVVTKVTVPSGDTCEQGSRLCIIL